MKRVIVIGCPGGGKSTFARALQKKTGLPLFHLDLLYWNADRTTVAKDVFLERLQQVLVQDRWILDGNYGSTLEMRLQACDTVFFLDYDTETCLDGIRTRKGKPHSDLPWVETEDDAEFLAYVENFRSNSRPKISALLKAYENRNLYTFRTREEADAFLQKGPKCFCGKR